MRIFYVTLSTADQARQISRALVEEQLAACTNWFPITSTYRWEERIVEETETVLIIKTQTFRFVQGQLRDLLVDRRDLLRRPRAVRGYRRSQERLVARPASTRGSSARDVR